MGRRGAPCPGNGFSGRAGKGAGPDVPLVRAASGADPRGRDGCGDEGHHPCRRGRHAALSRHQRGEQAAPARVRQAHDLLPAERPDARGDPGRPGDRHAAARPRLPAASGRRRPVGPRAPPRRAAEPRRSGASLPDRQGVHRQRPLRSGPRRQRLQRARSDREAAKRRFTADGGDGVRLPGPRPGTLRRGLLRRDRPPAPALRGR